MVEYQHDIVEVLAVVGVQVFAKTFIVGYSEGYNVNALECP
jgi:hypothetical protein